MGYINIDGDLCTGCGLCIDTCPSDVLEMGDKASQITRPELCISCGHCGAVCSNDAISSSRSSSRASFFLENMTASLPLEHALFHQKRSYRSFTSRKLNRETIKTMIQYGEKAPSSHNYRQREYIVVTDAEEIKRLEEIVVKEYQRLVKILNPTVIKITGIFSKSLAAQSTEFSPTFKNLVAQYRAGESPVFRAAPCVILIAAPKIYDQSRDDCVAAQNYMMLFAQSLGIGSCISGYAQYAHKKLAHYLKLPKDKQIFAISFFGYPRQKLKKAIRFADPPITWIGK